MNDYVKEALGLVRAQASVRTMTEDEMIDAVASLSKRLQALEAGDDEEVAASEEDAPVMDPKKSIKERTITCLVCGRTMKVITKKHLASHGLDAESYREKFGLKKGTPLSCKALVKMRREKMQSMKLWERCGAAKD